jgi:hypothetical protein
MLAQPLFFHAPHKESQTMPETLGPMGVLCLIFLAILSILWFFLPFAIFGIKGKLNVALQEMHETNQKLDELLQESSKANQLAAQAAAQAQATTER